MLEHLVERFLELLIPVCELMGMMTLNGDNLTQIIEKKGYITVCEPCIGPVV